MDGYFFMPLSLNKSFAIATASNNLFFFKSTCFSFLLCFFVIPVNAGKLEKSLTQETKFQADDLYKALAAEIYNKLGEDNLAVDFYYELSASNNDPAIAKRVTELATVTGQIAKALGGAKRWVVLKPNNLEANQYLTLLYLRNSHFKSAASILSKVGTAESIPSINAVLSRVNENDKKYFKAAIDKIKSRQ